MGRLDQITIDTTHSSIKLPWVSREALLAELRQLGGTETIVAAFEDVGASRPVQLTRPEQTTLLGALNLWAARTSLPDLPEGVWDLRNSLADDL